MRIPLLPRWLVPALGLLAPLFSTRTAAQVANDAFAAAEVLPATVTGTVAGSNIGATAQTGEPAHWTGQPPRRSVWYRWTPPNSGSVTFTTRGSVFDTLLAVYSGTSVGALSQLASNDDGGNDLGVQSQVTLTVTGGTTYSIAVDGFGGGMGAIQLNWALSGPPTISAQPQDATAVEGGTATFTVAADSAVALNYLWYRNGELVVPSRTNRIQFGPVRWEDDGALFVATAANRFGTVTSTPAVLRVTRDTTPPSAVSALNRGPTNVVVVFGEGVNAADVAAPGAFALDQGVSVVAAILDGDGRTARLHVTPLAFEREYQVTLSGIRDLANQPNPVVAGSRIRFVATEISVTGIGTGIADGSFVRNGIGDWTLAGAGNVIGGSLDHFQFASAERTGDFDVEVRVSSMAVTAGHMQAGLMARVDPGPGSVFAGVFASTPQLGSFFESRANPGLASVTTTAGSGFPTTVPEGRLRLRRTGNTFTGFASLDGTNWSRLGTATIEMPATVQVGFALAAEMGGRNATARFAAYGRVQGTAERDWTNRTDREPLGIASRKTGIVFSEIRHSGGPAEGTNAVEFIELYNGGPVFEDLSGWTLEGEVERVFPAGTRIEPGAFLVLAGRSGDFRGRYGFDPDGYFEGRLNGSGGVLRLRDERRALRLGMEYSDREPWPVAAAGTGHSIVLVRPSLGVDDPAAWAASAREGGSPGADDPWVRPALAAVRIEELLPRPGAGGAGFVELLNVSDSPVDLAGAALSDAPGTRRHLLSGGRLLGARERLVVPAADLPFALSPAGGSLFLVDAATNTVDALRYPALGAQVAFGWPADGARPLRPLAAATPGDANTGPRGGRIVVNEVQYRPLSGEEGDQFVELHNRGGVRLEIGGWALTDGVRFVLPAGVAVNPGGFVVVAKDRERLLRSHPTLDPGIVFGGWTGSLGGSGERVAFSRPELVPLPVPGGGTTNVTVWIEEDAMEWRDGGRWPDLADGGGSSLEKVDPSADGFRAASWAASDERNKAEWATFETTGTLDNGNGAYGFNQVQVTLQGAGEALVDGVEVLLGSTAYMTNGGFESGNLPAATGWTFQGNHLGSFVEEGGAWAGNRALHLVAPGRGDTGINRVRGLLRSGLTEGSRVTLRARARWVAGWPEVLVRLRGNWLELPIRLEVPRNLGTPGRANSRRLPNAGPAVFDVAHFPLLPALGEAVVVTARASDPDGVSTLTLLHRVDPSTELARVAMNDAGVDGDAVAGDGLWSGRIPARATAGVVAFRIAATDTPGAASVFPANAPAGEALVRWGDPRPFGTFGHIHLWNTVANASARGSQLNNTYRDATVVYNGVRAVYNAGFKDKGSPFHSGGGDYLLSFPRDQRLLASDSMVMASTGNGGNEDTNQREQMSFWIGRRLGTPYLNRRYVRFYRNGSAPRPIMEDSEEPDGDFTEYWYGENGQGELFKIEDWFEFDDAGTGFSNVDARLEPYFTDGNQHKTARYRWSWRKRAVDRTANDYSSLFQAASLLNDDQFETKAPALIDYENWARVLVQERICGNWDSFGMSRGKNMYAYKPASGPWKLIPWDIDFTLGTGNGPEDGLVWGNDPTVNRLYSSPAFLRRLYRVYREAVDGPLNPDQFEPQLAARTNALRANGIPFTSNRPIADYLSRRRATIVSTLTQNDAPTFSVGAPDDSSSTLPSVDFQAVAPLGVATLRVNGVTLDPTWTGPATFLLRLPLPVRTNVFEVVALDDRGEHVAGSPRTFTVVRPTAPLSVPATVRVNEIVAANAGGTADPADRSVDEDWIELHNPGSETVTLAGWRISDRTNFANAYPIPEGFRIPANGHLLVWADNETAQNAPGGDLHVPFRLSNDGEQVAVWSPDGTLVDLVTFGPLGDNQAFGRYPDSGSLLGILRAATPRRSNSTVGGPNQPPILAPLAARTVVAGQRLDLALGGTDPDNDRTFLRLGLDAPTGTRIEEGNRLRWIPAADQAGVHTFHLDLTDAGIPALSDSKTITVTVLAPEIPVIQTVNRTGVLSLRWEAQAGVRFRLEQTDDLASGRWTLLNEFVGTGAPVEGTLPSDASARWFRLRIP